jgi:hypothetical protein
VRWAVDGANVRTENFAPWALGGDQNGSDLLPYSFPSGNHTLTVTAYSASNGTGTLLKTMSVSFSVTNDSTTPPPPSGGHIDSLMLMNADTDQPIGEFVNNTTINYAVMPQNLTVQAFTSGLVGSIRWGLDGNSNFRTESYAPWALGGDINGSDLLPFAFSLGSHTMTVTAFSGSGGTGAVLHTISLSFNVGNEPVSQPPNQPSGGTINSLTLVNADNDQPIGQFENNTTIDYRVLPAHLTVRAETSGTIGSVQWIINGQPVRVENYAPWALGGDQNTTDLLPYAFQNGTHMFTIIAFGEKDAKGAILKKIDLTFNVGFAPQ